MSLSVIKEAMSVLDTISRLPTGAITFTNAVMSIFHVLSIILTTNGAEGWHTHVNKAMGEGTLTPEDERNLQPIVHLLLKIRDSKATDSLESLFKQQGGAAIDKAYMSGLEYITQINQKVSQFAANSGMGITAYQNQMDMELDPRPFKPLKSAGVVGMILAQVPVPVRLMIFLLYSSLDIIRIMTAGSPIMRQLLSVTLAGIELLKGDWKKSLLSMSGVFAQPLVYTGFVGKIFLELFSMISPQLQDSIAVGALRVTKSILLGFFIQLFKMIAPETTRIRVIKQFKALSKKKGCLDQALVAAGLPTRSDGLATETGITQNEARNCSTEFFQDAIQAAEESKIMNVALQLANIPTTEEDAKENCKKFMKYADENGYISWKDLLVGEGLMQLTEEEEGKDTMDEEMKELPEAQVYIQELETLKTQIPKVIAERKKAGEEMAKLLKEHKAPSTAAQLAAGLKADAYIPKLPTKQPTVYDIHVTLPPEVAAATGISVGPTGAVEVGAPVVGPTGAPTGAVEGPTGTTSP